MLVAMKPAIPANLFFQALKKSQKHPQNEVANSLLFMAEKVAFLELLNSAT